MALKQTVTKTSASTDISTYTTVNLNVAPDCPTGSNALGHQAARIGGTLNASGGSATVRFALTDGTTVYKVVDVAFTDSAVRTAIAGSSGNYIATVAATNADYIDLLGADAKADSAKPTYWVVGLSALTTATSVTIDIYPTRCI